MKQTSDAVKAPVDTASHATVRRVQFLPRLPLRGNLDLTYRCNNNCLHCWLRLPANARAPAQELSVDEIRRIADEARAMGTREWVISGGEPMLRPDFPEIFDYLTRKAVTYTLNTNGTLITPDIARMLTSPGRKLVALYGATAEVYNRVTRTPGAFEQVMQGFRYLKEAGAGFVVQLIPLRANWHQWAEMVELARSLSKDWRVGASWLYLSADGDPQRNAEIASQRLDPADLVALNPPDLTGEAPDQALPSPNGREEHDRAAVDACRSLPGDDRLFASCIFEGGGFHVDPYGAMTFCAFIKDPALRYDLRTGTFREAWDAFIPSLADRVVRSTTGSPENRSECPLLAECDCCPVYAYLEHRDFSATVEYKCEIAKERRRYKERWFKDHRRYYRIGGITIRVDSDLPFTEETFDKKFTAFRTDGPGADMVTIRHHFSLEGLCLDDLGGEVYRKPPWTIHRKGDSWIYLSMTEEAESPSLRRVATFDHDHTHARICHKDAEEEWLDGGLTSLTLFPTDQIVLARLLADRQGCVLHSAGAILDGKGLLFAGTSEAGKTTVMRMLQDHAEILCDDRNIVRHMNNRFHVYGTWSHGDLSLVSASSAPLTAILFLCKSSGNGLRRLTDTKEIIQRLLGIVIRPLVTPDWWEKTLDVIGALAREVPCYEIQFALDKKIVRILKGL